MDLDVAALELATLDAVPPRQLVTLDGWVAGLDDGTVGRAHSAVPTRHHAVDAGAVDVLEALYARHGLPATFRVPVLPAFAAVRQRLVAGGATPRQPTLTMTGRAEAVSQAGCGEDVHLEACPGQGWSDAFLGEGFDPAEGAGRLAILRRSRSSVFAAVQRQGQVVAVGAACLGRGWCGIHGMRTAPAWRGRGLAGSILATFGRLAAQRGIGQVFLQVEQANSAAQHLYRRVGLQPAWTYEYWRR
ncbi:MAG TPA: GNAT family N-acetyltransferase [Ramlibacter sp.]|jgi:GNAT superfamily N-acetyltransferase|uniref:GNAT family N-acetyltransferase n=1 Tax=Ramlibacter sp. TaxID=1917967 RepID=UPI002D5AA739|nr:GNAT family N-acetyltransferase [Ramlibacter sp.]HZY19551.1 GNAT family N-acetyltransferase [Ramlibacter sp.]